ncbi:MAG: hypothetical protein AAGG01_20075, partial [Planctomycetota bacterium]
ASNLPHAMGRFANVPLSVGSDLHLRSVAAFDEPSEVGPIALSSGSGWLAISVENRDGHIIATRVTNLVEIPVGSTELVVRLEP